jgi:hypothetical protein
MFDPTSYRSVHNLATNTDKRHFEDLIKKTAEAVFMAKVNFKYMFSSIFSIDQLFLKDVSL